MLADEGNVKYFILAPIFFFEAILIIWIIKTVYEKPIIELEYTIKRFILWQLKNQKIDIESSTNPHLDYVIKFFSKTLNTLKNIKDEFVHGKEIKSEVTLAREIQDKLLAKTLLSIPSLNIIAKSKPAGEIGGDSYDVIQEWDNYYMYVGDATGHGVCFKIKSGWVALGMIKDINKLLKEQEVKFEKNDIIVLYSDGITECINQPTKTGSEQMFGEERLITAIESAPKVLGKAYKNASNVFNNITIEVSRFMGYKHTQLDDVTLVVIHYRGDDYDIKDDANQTVTHDLLTEWHW